MSSKRRRPGWNLYWVTSDGYEDCFVVARNSRSACSVELHMNGFDVAEVSARRVMSIPSAVAMKFGRLQERDTEEHPWPWYAYRDLLEQIGAEFREVDGVEEIRLGDVVYARTAGGASFTRSIGATAVQEMLNNKQLQQYPDKQGWTREQMNLLTMIGISVARCHEIEHYIAHSFIFFLADSQKRRYKTINDAIAGWKRQTLGTSLRIIEEGYEIDPIVQKGLKMFLDMRNRLVHGLTVSERFDIRTRWGCDELAPFLILFDALSRVVERAFRASYLASLDYGYQYLMDDKALPKHRLTSKDKKEMVLFAHFFTPRMPTSSEAE